MIRVGVIGCGYWGPLHVRNFTALPGATVTIAADLSHERLAHIAATYPHVRTTADVADLLDGPVDAVVISTPAGTHARLAEMALARGKHALVEKPLATSAADAAALVALAAQHGCTLMVGHTFLYHAAVRALRDLVRAGSLGDIFYIDSKRVNLGLHRKDVDVVWDLATHDLAILRDLLGADPITAEAYGAAFHDPDTAEVAYVQLRYPGNVLANLHVSWLDPVKVRRMTVVGSRRMAVWDDVEPVDKLRVYDRGMERRPYHDDFGQWQVAYRYGEGATVPIHFEEPLRLQAAEFLRAIHCGDTPLTGGADGLAVVRTLEQATAAMRLTPAANHERLAVRPEPSPNG
jgi:predicted dehydrogenase